MADPMLTSLCAICHVAPPKYKCPRCGLRSCSLKCTTKHKAWSACSGTRDPTAYLPPSRLRTPAGVDHDYNFLHGIERSLQRAERVLVDERHLVHPEELRPMTVQEVRWKAGRDGRKRKVLVTRLLRDAKGRRFERFLAQRLRKLKVEVLCMPTGMTRQKENSTTLNRKTSRINWQVEWFLIDDDAEAEVARAEEDEASEACNATRVLSKVMDNVPLHEAYRTMLDEQEAAKRRQAKKDGRTIDEEPIYHGNFPKSRCLPSRTAMQDPQTGLWFTCTGPNVETWPQEKQLEYQYFLAQPQTRRPDKRLAVSPLQTTDCLRDVLTNTRVLEFPTIIVLRSGTELPESYILGPKDSISPMAAPSGGSKRKDGPAGGKEAGDRAAKKRKSDDVEEGEVDEYEDSDGGAGGLVKGAVIDEQSMDENEDDDTSSSGSPSESESDTDD
ncbi:Zinc finger, HIT-type [Cordyceps fumosorosea ARSEF 2679]|uniref:Box C/D snoRNA protein 1 n=1 Tax=Cordyceps fumosorosea (strain ARSEF 2679) TaxID=1081104 RepID=A0A167R298_CORFA|nr:Zinc finger, HIT-type [Cordyceps fumosorosea ARSEF 2679]OAA58204.1 Zinc finger, HIT-type [Cordyceps fumosorosea ARSEF 2679]